MFSIRASFQLCTRTCMGAIKRQCEERKGRRAPFGAGGEAAMGRKGTGCKAPTMMKAKGVTSADLGEGARIAPALKYVARSQSNRTPAPKYAPRRVVKCKGEQAAGNS
jgi:hypothetical protein